MEINKDIKHVVDRLYQEAAKIEFEPCSDVVRTFKYQIIPSKMGGFDNQALTTMVFAAGDCRALSAYMLFVLARLVDRPAFEVEQLKELFKETVPLSAEFLYTCGLDCVWDITKEVIAVMDKVSNKTEFKELIEALAYYVNNVHNWVLFYFPWYAGEMFPQQKKENVKEMAQMLGL